MGPPVHRGHRDPAAATVSTIEVYRWWRVVVYGPMGSILIDNEPSREAALARAAREDAPGWTRSRVIEFTERGRDREVEDIR